MHRTAKKRPSRLGFSEGFSEMSGSDTSDTMAHYINDEQQQQQQHVLNASHMMKSKTGSYTPSISTQFYTSSSPDPTTEVCSSPLPCREYDDDWDITISFSCGGWFQMYYFGAALALLDSGLLHQWAAEGRRVRFCGSSAGALAATCLAAGQHSFEAIREFCIASAKHFRSSIFHIFHMKKYLESSFDVFGTNLLRIDTDPAFREWLSSGCLGINVSVLPKVKCKEFTKFNSYEEIREILLASCCMVPLVGAPFKMKSTGDWVVDGGFSNFTPHMAEPNCISVSGMYFQDASVRPRVFVPSWWALCPPNETKYRNLFWMGYNDMIDHLVTKNLLSHDRGEALLKPEVDFRIHDSVLEMIFTFFAELTMLLCVRPVVVVCIYVELFFSMTWHAFKCVLTLERGSLWKMYDNFRSAVSLRTLGRLLFGTKVPNNEERLNRRSKVFRVFKPVVLGGERRTGRECRSPGGSPLGRIPQLSPVANAQRAVDYPR